MEFEITITSMGSNGEGVGHHEGRPVFIEGALPGESVLVESTIQKKKYLKAKIVKILKESPERTKAPCPYFSVCGGCQLMHLSDSGQLTMKRQRVVDALERIGGLKGIEVAPTLASRETLHYRNKVQLPLSPNGKLGLYARGTHRVVEVERCLIHCDQGEALLKEVRKAIRESKITPYNEQTGRGELRHVLIRSAISTGESLLLFVTTGKGKEKFKRLAEQLLPLSSSLKGVYLCINKRRDNVILSHDYHHLVGEKRITETINDLHFSVSPASFFQVNPKQAEQLYATALEFAELKSGDILLDAYCGVGTLALLAASKVKEVIGVEVVPEAIVDAKANAKRNGVQNATFHCAATEKALELFEKVDVVLINPPRKGCDEKVIDALLTKEPKRIVYVSCDPATLARDLKRLSTGYNVIKVQPVDMFPQTSHVETVVLLQKKSPINIL